jgi:tetratricopeptide (TPR) repeat protein
MLAVEDLAVPAGAAAMPASAQDAQAQAQALTQRRDWAAAAVAWRAAIAQFPRHARALWWHRLSHALRESGDLDGAAAAAATGREAWPGQPSGWQACAEVAAAREDWAAAASGWQACIDRFPAQAPLGWYVGLGTALQKGGRVADGIALIEAARDRWPDDPRAWYELAKAVAAAHGWRRGARIWQAGLARPAVAAATVYLPYAIDAMLRAGMAADAGRWAEALCDLSPRDISALRWRVNVLDAAGDARGVVDALRALAGLDGFRRIFPMAHLAKLLIRAALPMQEAVPLLEAWAGREGARQALEALSGGAAGNPEDVLAAAGTGTPPGPALRGAWGGECRRRLRDFLRDRRYRLFEALAAAVVAHGQPRDLRRLLAIAEARFPRSALRHQLARALKLVVTPAEDPEEAFASNWRRAQAGPAMSIAPQLAALRFRRLVCVVVVRDEDEVLRHFIEHHRALGVTAFIIIDNRSAEHPAAVLAGIEGVELTFVSAPQSFVAARHGMMWINDVLEARLCDWLLFLDADELLTYPGADRLPLPALLDHLDQRGETAMLGTMVDVYDRGIVRGGMPSAGMAEQQLFHASRVVQGSLVAPWCHIAGGLRALSRHTTMMHKLPLVKAGAGIRYVSNHHATSCVVAATSAVLVHVKIMRDRDLLAQPADRLLAHPRVRDRRAECMARHLAFRRLDRRGLADDPFHVPLTEDRLLRLGFMAADAAWRAAIGRPMARDRSAAAEAVYRALAASGQPALAECMADMPLRTLLPALRHLAGEGARDALRRLLNAQLPRIGRPEVARAVLLYVAVLLGRAGAARRLHAATGRAMRAAGGEACGAGLAAVAQALSREDAALALRLVEAARDLLGEQRDLTAAWLQALVVNRRWPVLRAAMAGRPLSLRDGTLLPCLHLMDAQRDWATYRQALEAVLAGEAPQGSRILLHRIAHCPDPEARQALRHRMAETLRPRAEGLEGVPASVFLALLHLLGRDREWRDAHGLLQGRLPAEDRLYWGRVLAMRDGGAPCNRAWALGLSKTGTTSLHEYCRRLGLLSAHWINPFLGTLIDRADADVFDVVSDTPVVQLARQGGPPAGRLLIATTRGYEAWARSYLAHFSENFAIDAADFDTLRRVFDGGGPFRFGAPWRAIHQELYFRFGSLREAFEHHEAWTAGLARQGLPLLHLPIEAEGKARLVSDFLGLGVAAGGYPHANRGRAPGRGGQGPR